MDGKRKEQLEALKVLRDFQDKFISNTEILIDELSTERKEDTDKLLKSVTDAVNWEVGVLNGTLSYVNEKEELLSKEEINRAIMEVAGALQAKGDKTIARALEKELLPMLKKVKDVLEGICKQAG